ncbi:hypothetical protein [Rhodanobacter lindaniclasticus]
MVAEDRTVVAFGGFVQLDPVILDRRSLQLFGDALLHVTRGLTDLQLPLVGGVGDGIGVDARARGWLGREDFIDGLTHRQPHHPPRRWRAAQ